jgi:3-methylfumaryl-CoA hydratase
MTDFTWQEWVGRTEERLDWVSSAPITQLAATLDLENIRTEDGQPTRPLWHWLYFTPTAKQSDIGVDGHPNKGHFLPPIPLPRRMWAGSRVVFHEALRVGEKIRRVSRIARVESKQGRSGPLVFITVQHEIQQAGMLSIAEEHDIAYRDVASPNEAASGHTLAPVDDTFSRLVIPDPVLLFRYSALTFNGHRIHYDRPYATEVESYPGLVVHGPLIATLLLDLLHREIPEAKVKRFEFKGVSPLFDSNSFAVCGRKIDATHTALWAKNHKGQLAMQATAELH